MRTFPPTRHSREKHAKVCSLLEKDAATVLDAMHLH